MKRKDFEREMKIEILEIQKLNFNSNLISK